MLLYAALFSLNARSQNTVFFMDHLPQTLSMNPASAPEVSFFISLPGIGNNQFNVYNSGFNAGQFIDYLDDRDTEGYNPASFIRSIGDYNETFAETRTNLFAFGFKTRRGYFSFSASERNFMEMKVSPEILYLSEDADQMRENLPIDIDHAMLRLNMFTQLALTWSRQFGERLTFGVSPKLTGALGGITTDNFMLKGDEISENMFQGRFKGDITIGLPVPINPRAIREDGKYETSEDLFEEGWEEDLGPADFFENAGFALDLAANYDLSENLTLSAGVLDLGKSVWKKNAYRFSLRDTTYLIDMDEEFDIPLIDSTYNVYKDQVLKMNIPSTLFLAARYKLSPRWNTGFLFRNTLYHGMNLPSATLSLNGYVGRMLSTSVSYTAARDYDNLGLGIRLRFLPWMDLYAVADNFLDVFDYKKVQDASVAFGINFSPGLLPKREKKNNEEEKEESIAP